MQGEMRRHVVMKGDRTPAPSGPRPTPWTISRLGATTTLSRVRGLRSQNSLSSAMPMRELAAGDRASDSVDKRSGLDLH